MKYIDVYEYNGRRNVERGRDSGSGDREFAEKEWNRTVQSQQSHMILWSIRI